LRAKALALPPTHLSAELRFVIDRAAFFFTRDTISRDYLKAQGVKTPILEFGPDAQLGMHLRDDAKGFAYLKACGLEQGKFICVIPRLRYTPYHKFEKNRTPAPSDAIKDAINARTVEQDHVKLRDLMIAYVRKTGNKVLACPEMTYEIELSKEVLVDPLPADVKKNVVWRDTYWLPDEAASVYSQALALVSIECHSPLIALHYGTPTIHIRNPTDTCKGQMFRDIGMDDWFFEIDETSGAELWSRVEAIHRDPAKARAKVKTIFAGIEQRQQHMIATVRTAVTRG
jgi:polysaccharide pyruvyl transferase WcaK-like protein